VSGLACAEETAERWTDPLLLRRKGYILFRRDCNDPAPAQDALRAAIEVAEAQGSRGFGLRAALSLAELYRSTGRPVEAHAVLAPALEGFALTPEMPEIAEASVARTIDLRPRRTAKPTAGSTECGPCQVASLRRFARSLIVRLLSRERLFRADPSCS